LSGPPPLDPQARATLQKVLDLLAVERASVSSVTDPSAAWNVHVQDSLSGLEVPELKAATKVADIGSGAGFPGLVLAVSLPAARVDLIESVERKCKFIRTAIAIGEIANASVIHARSEEIASSPRRETYDVVTARAVGRLSTLAELASPLLRKNGVLIAWKGRRDPDEEAQLSRAAAGLAVQPEQVLHVGPYAGSKNRHLHVIRKIGSTPRDLPRRAGMAKKRPRG
jgi:16S rRNA (guanine527-N7)-methyltransferase